MKLTREQRSGANSYDIQYTYDNVGNRSTKVDASGTTTYNYDNAGQVTALDLNRLCFGCVATEAVKQ